MNAIIGQIVVNSALAVRTGGVDYGHASTKHS
jgi:hypothetical protein